jgi:phosphoribosylanthranilate isomerase
MFVKICGLTTLGDTLAAFEQGATAAGFNFYRKSPRYVEPASLRNWIGEVPPGMLRVGVFVNEKPERVMEIASELNLDVAQLHGDEKPADIPAGIRVWKAARIRAGLDVTALGAFQTEAILLDGPANGVAFNWGLASPGFTPATRKIILAGGLDEHNVQEAVQKIRPWGVDVCSRIESFPGKKDHVLMRRFIQTALSC